MHNRSICYGSSRFVGLTAIIWVIIATTMILSGCEEQPTGYIYKPMQRDQIQVASTVFDFLHELYNHTDEAANFLNEAALTNDYASVLPEGWLPSTDGMGNTYYERNYLDQQFQDLWFDPNPNNNAIRTPSELRFNYLEIGSFLNYYDRTFYADTSETFSLAIEYSNARQDPQHVDGLFQIQRAVEFFTEGTTVLQDGSSVSYSENYWVLVTWLIKIDQFSVDPDDHSGHFTFDGIFPFDDETYQRHEAHVSGEVTLDKNGRGNGEVWLMGEPVARIRFNGRSFGFNGYFTLYSEDHENLYR